jgi:hypothetical protein
MSEGLATQYRVKAPFTTGYLSRMETSSSTIILRAGALLECVPTTEHKPLLGMVQVLWQGCEYSIFERDLQEKRERVSRQAGA